MINYDDIKHSVSIGEVLRRYGFRVPARDNYRIACPLHGGRDANFSVSERAGLWNCFSVCGRGGSVIDLVSALEKIDIKEAAHKLGSDFNISPAQASVAVARATINKIERWRALKAEAVEMTLPFELSDLKPGYRGLTQASIDHWGLARVPGGVFIPLLSNKGKLCSFAVRRDDGNPKYDNAKGISKCLPFGAYENAGSIVGAGFAWVVEGQFDAIMLWQKGYRNVVALMGSSLSEQQAMLLLALTSKLELCMDGDEAGRLAAAKIRKAWGPVFEIGEFVLPEGVDPDEFTGILEREKHDTGDNSK
jgi:DNA primase